MIPGLPELVWREPLWLWLALWPWLLLAWRFLTGGRSSSRYAERKLLPWAEVPQDKLRRAYRYWRELCAVFAWLLLAAALAGPRIPQGFHSEQRDRLPELMVVLDVSHSMSANDIYPTRLERAKLELHDLLTRIQGWRVGLVLYAAEPHLLVPPSHDKTLLRYYLTIPRDGLLPIEGSNPSSALRFAATTTKQKDIPRTLLWISDGELHNDDAESLQNIQETVTTLRQESVSLYILGVGSKNGTTLTDPEGGWLEDNGQGVVSRLHDERLNDLAARGGGRYTAVSDDSTDWQTLYDNGIARQSANVLGNQDNGLIIWRELFAWFLIPGLLLLLLAHTRRPRINTVALSWLPVLLISSLTLYPAEQSHADNTDTQRQAWQAWQNDNYQQAREYYRLLPGFSGRMGEGSSAYRQEDYRSAVQQFTRAVMSAKSDSQRADALFNLANCYARLERYSEAIAIYEDVLLYRAGDPLAQHNLAVAREQARKQSPGQGSSRQGRGNNTRDLEEGENLTRGSLTLDEGEQDAEGFAIQGQDDKGPDDGPAGSRATLADESVQRIIENNWDYTIERLDQLEAQRFVGNQTPARLWQRLFETEAGYPAPLEQPDTRQGVPPW